MSTLLINRKITMKTNNKVTPKQETEKKIEVVSIPLNKIQASKLNPRRFFDESSLLELADSIKKVGVIQPITVRTVKSGKYEIVCGERRYRASLLAEKADIPACIKDCTDSELLDMAFIENIQREEVSEIETAEAIKSFIDTNKEDFNSMAIRLGKSVKSVRDRYQLNSLIDEIKALVHNNTLSVAKAVLLSSYEEEQQQKIHGNYLMNQHNSWLDLSYSKFVSSLNSHFNTNLSTAKFDLSECEKCPFNSAVSSLFVEDENKKCLKKECFIAKQQNFSIQKAIAQIEENPTYVVIQSYSESWFLKALAEHGIEVTNSSSTPYKNYPSEPDQPEKPKESDYIDEETKQLDQQEWITAKGDYEDEMGTYKEDLEEYQKEVAEIEQKIAERKIERCFVIRGTSVDTEMRFLSEDEMNCEDISSNEKAELDKLIKQDDRNAEIKIENSVKDIKDILFPNDKHLINVEGTKAEQDILFYYIFLEISRDSIESFFNGKYPSDKEMFDFVSKMTTEQRMSIIRSFIISKLRSYAHSSKSVSTQLLIEFAKMHKEKETLDILAKYQTIYDKRKANIETKKKDIVSVGELVEETSEQEDFEE
jgi:ParB family chromosome partitioning protein